MSKNLFSDSKCKYESYDKNEIDTNFYNKHEVDQKIAVVRGYGYNDATAVLKTFSANYPTGFTKNNCAVIGYKITTLDENNLVKSVKTDFGVYDSLGGAFNSIIYGDNGITFYLNRLEQYVIEGDTDFVDFFFIKNDPAPYVEQAEIMGG